MLRLSYFIIAFLLLAIRAQSAGTSFVQVNSATPQTPQTTVTVTYSAAQTAGDLNVVVVGWNDSTAQISSITDTRGNAYALAVGPTVQGGTAAQAIFYAKNIAAAAAGANTVTVTFTAAAIYPDIRIAEYSGLDTVNPLDVSVGTQGNSATSNSGPLTTTNANDLLVGANLVQTITTGPGTGFTNRVITSPDGDILEDRVVAATGSFSATAALGSSGGWIMQLAAFRAAGSGGPAPSISSLSQTSGAVGAAITITGTNFGNSQGSSTVTFGGTAATTFSSWSTTSIGVTVPAGANTGNVVVTVGTLASNGVNFTVILPPSISSLSQTSGAVGTAITITGTNFGNSQGSSTVTFGSTAATTFSSWSTTSIGVTVPAGANTGNVVATVSGAASNGVRFVVTGGIKLIQHVSKDAGTTTSSSLAFASNNTAGSWIAVVVRAGKSGQVFSVTDSNGNTYHQAIQFSVTVDADTLGIFYAENIKGGANTVSLSDTISGTMRFAILEYSGVATANSLDVTAVAQGTGTAPSSGNATTTASGDLLLGAILSADPANFTAGSGYTIEESVPAEPNTKLIVEDQAQGNAGTASASASLAASDPWGAALAAFKAAGTSGVVTGPSITGVSPTSGSVGTSVTITGTNLGTTRGTVTFNGTAASPTNWSNTTIVTPVPSGATTGNIVVTASGVASNGVVFTVVASSDTTPPTVSITSPASGATVSGTVSVTANASDNVAVANVQFQVDGSNVGNPVGAAPYSYSLNTTTLSNATHVLTAVATDTSNNTATSAGVSISVNNAVGSGATGPLVQSSSNSHYFVNPAGQAVLLSGSHTWDDFQDTDLTTSPAALDFTAYVNFLKSHGHNVTILWKKDLPTYCNWGAGGTWTMAPFPWLRPGPGTASDGKPKFDLTQLDQSYFDRLRARVIQLQQNGIYAIVELFDGLGLASNRCSIDGYPFTGGNNVNSVDDGGGTNSMTMSGANTITGYQDAYVQKVIDTLNDQPNVLWEISEEAPDNSTWWQGHMISLIRSYEGGKPYQHPIGFPSLNVSGASDSTLYNSNADWVAPAARLSPTSSCGSGTPSCKVNINDSDHSYYGMWNDSAQVNRNYVWENFTRGDTVIFMDPYLIFWSSGNRNLCSSPVNGVCSAADTRWDNFRDNLGYVLTYANTRLDLLKMTPQGNLCSTGYCLADNVAAGAEYLVSAPNGGSFTVNLSVTTHVLSVEWLNPSTGATSSGGLVTGGSTHSFTPPFRGDAVLYLVDSAGHN